MIQAFRISFLFTRTYLEVFKNDTTSDYPVKEYNDYLGVFEDLKNNNNGKSYPWNYPWKNELIKNRFWFGSLQETGNDFSIAETKSEKSANIFEEYVAAFFYKMNYSLEFNSENCIKPIKINLQLYAYQHGLGLIINPYIPKKNCDKQLVVDIIKELRFNSEYTLKCDLLTEEYDRIDLQNTADVIMKHFQEKYKLGEYRQFSEKQDPFSIITILSNGEKTDLQAAEEFSPLIFESLKEVFKNKIPVHKKDQNLRVDMFASKKSRIIWSGLNVQKPFRVKRKLIMNHYHNNISKLSLQIESLGDLLRQYQSKKDLNQYYCLKRHVDYAQRQLVNFYNGKNNGVSTYNSKSAIEQINDNGYLKSINIVRAQFYIDPIDEINI